MAYIRYIAIGIVLIALFTLGMWSGGFIGGSDAGKSGDIEDVTINGEAFHLILSVDRQAIQKGLMGVEEIETDGGMLFVHSDYNYRNYWMKNCLTDIDILFLSDVGRIVAMHEMKAVPLQQPDETEREYEDRVKEVKYESNKPAKFAIELRPGTIKRLSLQVGETIELDLRRLKRLAR